MICLCQTKETYYVDTEQEVEKMIKDAKDSADYEVVSYSRVSKFDKKTETEYFVVNLVKKVSDMKEPNFKFDLVKMSRAEWEEE